MSFGKSTNGENWDEVGWGDLSEYDQQRIGGMKARELQGRAPFYEMNTWIDIVFDYGSGMATLSWPVFKRMVEEGSSNGTGTKFRLLSLVSSAKTFQYGRPG